MGRGRADRLDDAVAEQELRAAVAGHVAGLGGGCVEVAAELLEGRPLLAGGRTLGEQPEMDPNADEPLLGAVVEVPLDPDPLEVDRVEGPDARPPQLAFEGEA